MEPRVQKWGNSLALRIPKMLATQIGLRQDASVEIVLIDGKLVISPIASPAPTLEELLAQISESNLHSEVDFGRATGKEVW